MSLKLERSKPLYDQLVALYPECAAMWKYIVSLAEVPRPSGSTQLATEWVADIGRKLGGTVKIDHLGNVAVAIPATKGKEHLPAIVLQAHLDMVGTKSSHKEHCFTSDPIHAYIEGDLLRAHDTTLGADDGSGVAAILALAEDKALQHAPIELLFTVDEEIGLVGAGGLKEGELLSPNAKYLINVDSEDWGEICLSCAGGVDRLISIPMHRAPLEAGWTRVAMQLKDFRGGHTGVEIHAGRANAVKWATAILSENREAIAGCPYRVARFDGGNAHNAVPSHVNVEFAVPEARVAAFLAAASDVFHQLNLRFAHIEKPSGFKEPRCEFTKIAEPAKDTFLTFSSTRTMLCFLDTIHHGVYRWSEEIPSLVETSESLSVAKLEGDVFACEIFARSSKNESLAALSVLLESIATLYGGKSVVKIPDLPGWPAEPDCRLVRTAIAVFKEKVGKDPKVVSIHAGLECGIIMNKFPANKIEAISVGPTIRNPHTVDEEMELKTAAQLYKYLFDLIQALSA